MSTPGTEENYKLLQSTPIPEWLTNQDQRDIWAMFEELKVLAIKKNHDYGSSVFRPPVLPPGLPIESSILVRLSDKVSRMQTLLANPNTALVAESLSDTMKDMGTYAFLYVIAQKRQSRDLQVWKKVVEDAARQGNGYADSEMLVSSRCNKKE